MATAWVAWSKGPKYLDQTGLKLDLVMGKPMNQNQF